MKEKNSRKGIKKLLFLCCVTAAIAALMCVTAFAENVAKFNDTEYATVEEALKAARDNGDGTDRTVTLLSNATIDISGDYGVFQIWQPIKIDGQGQYGISINGAGAFEIQAGTGVTFENMVINDTTAHTQGYFFITGNGKLILKNTTVTAYGGFGGPIFSKSANANVTMINSKIVNAKSGWDNCYGSAVCLAGGGTFEMDATSEITGCQGGSYAVSMRPEPALPTSSAPGSITINGKISGNPGGAVYAGPDVTVTLGENANITGNGTKVAVKTENTAEGSVKDDSALVYGCYNNTYYEPSVVVVNGSGTLYTDAYTAINGTNGTVYLLKDAEFGAGNLYNANTVTIDGQGHKLIDKASRGVIAHLTFKNVTLDISTLSGSAFSMWDKSITLDNGAIVDGGTYDAEGNVTRGAARFLGGNNGTFNMYEGSAIKNVSAPGGNGGAIVLEGNAKINITGGEITGCKAQAAGGAINIKGSVVANISGGSITGNKCGGQQGGGIYVEGGTLNISGNANITGNLNGDGACNIYGSADKINVIGAFTGNIGIRNDSYGVGVKIATAGTDCSLASTDSVVCDNGALNHFAYVSGSELLLTKKLTLESETDQGKYTKAGGETVCGVVRVNTTVTDIVDASLVVEIGTYFYTGTSENTEKTENRSVTVTPSVEKFVEGNGYMADVYGITDSTATVYAVNFYKLKGIDGYIFSDPISVTYVANTAKSVEYTE